jgi:hypothetical protein
MRAVLPIEPLARASYLPSMQAKDELSQTIAAWATEVGMHAAQLASHQARVAYLAERRHELVAVARQQGMDDSAAAILADACVDGARRIMTAVLARGTPSPEGRA